MKNKYSKEYYCKNCGRSFRGYFEMGEVASQGKCPNCGVTPEDLERKRLEKRIGW